VASDMDYCSTSAPEESQKPPSSHRKSKCLSPAKLAKLDGGRGRRRRESSTTAASAAATTEVGHSIHLSCHFEAVEASNSLSIFGIPQTTAQSGNERLRTPYITATTSSRTSSSSCGMTNYFSGHCISQQQRICDMSL
jgi:hypothetical protein